MKSLGSGTRTSAIVDACVRAGAVVGMSGGCSRLLISWPSRHRPCRRNPWPDPGQDPRTIDLASTSTILPKTALKTRRS
jgi:hypothetical protein